MAIAVGPEAVDLLAKFGSTTREVGEYAKCLLRKEGWTLTRRLVGRWGRRFATDAIRCCNDGSDSLGS